MGKKVFQLNIIVVIEIKFEKIMFKAEKPWSFFYNWSTCSAHNSKTKSPRILNPYIFERISVYQSNLFEAKLKRILLKNKKSFIKLKRAKIIKY
jgi:hypothetical protein